MSILKQDPILIFFSGVLFCAYGCANDNDEREGYCDDTIVELSPTEESIFGYAAQEKIDEIEGVWTCVLVWGEIPEAIGEISPASGTVDAEITFAYNGGEIREITSAWVGPNSRVSCLNRIEIDLEMSFVSSDGALDERWEVTVEAMDDTNFYLYMNPSTFDGSFSMTLSDEETAPDEDAVVSYSANMQIALALGYRDASVEGDLAFWIEDEQSVDTDTLGQEVVSGSGESASIAAWVCSL